MEKIPDLSDLLEAFKFIGKKVPIWTQAQGSNLSLKDEARHLMHIKPSGYRLDQVKGPDDIVSLSLDSLGGGLSPLMTSGGGAENENKYAQAINTSKVEKNSSLRPSMETGFHFALRKKFVFHFHSLAAIVMSYFFEAERQRLLDFFKKHTHLAFAFADYATPGLELTQILIEHSDKNILLLKNHGVILNLDRAEDIQAWESFEKEFCREFLKDQKLTEFRVGDPLPELAQGVPLKVLFPDFAVFLKRLSGCLLRVIPDQDLWIFDPTLIATEKDMYEVWLAYVLLYTACPKLESLMENEIGKISTLPTEQFRLMMKP